MVCSALSTARFSSGESRCGLGALFPPQPPETMIKRTSANAPAPSRAGALSAEPRVPNGIIGVGIDVAGDDLAAFELPKPVGRRVGEVADRAAHVDLSEHQDLV